VLRYFTPQPGISTSTHDSNQHWTFDTKVIMPTMPWSHDALDGILDNDLSIV